MAIATLDTTDTTAARVVAIPPATEDASAGADAVQPVVRVVEQEVERQILESGLIRPLERKVLAQFSEPSRDGDRSRRMFGLLTLYSYESAGGTSLAIAAPAAAAVEFAAVAASVLDDLQDFDPVIGTNPDVPADGAELLALLLVLSQRAMASLTGGDIPPARAVAAHGVLSSFELRALSGQHQANRLGSRPRVRLKEAAEATDAKSGSFGRLAAEVGAALATDDEEAIAGHGEFGRNAAIIDQMHNDVAGIWPGGAPSTDITLGRRTPPVVFALEVPDGVSKAADAVKQALREGSPGGSDEGRIREALFRSGAIH